KARLVLAIIVYQQPNFLLLDEPTNHLDLEMRFALGVALQDFSGALVVVSHDRHLLRSVTDELYLVADKKVTVYDGDLDDYKAWLREQNMEAQQKSPPTNGGKNETSVFSKKEQRQQAADKRDALKPLTNKIKNLELQMENLQVQKEQLQTQLADPGMYVEKNKFELKTLLKKQAETEKPLQQLEEQWLLLNEELESVQR
ncbi:MAG: ABC transporter ATP-binding protein, partial [Colwellia sp.]|nr:ABC transporter ATP-binding protein [Colwellia sp.]